MEKVILPERVKIIAQEGFVITDGFVCAKEIICPADVQDKFYEMNALEFSDMLEKQNQTAFADTEDDAGTDSDSEVKESDVI